MRLDLFEFAAGLVCTSAQQVLGQAELQKWDPASKNKNKNKQSESPWFDDTASQVRTLAVQTW